MKLRLEPRPQENNPKVLRHYIRMLHDELAEAYLQIAGVPAAAHATDCAINQAPAHRPGPCDCGAWMRHREFSQ
jgi:hypothetical protein